MKEIFKLALRNLKEHKSKTIIIALFLVFGVAIVVLGNSFLESVNRGLEKDFRNNYTGDIAISIKPEKGTMIDLFGYQTTDISSAMSEIAAIPDLDKVMQIIENQEGIKAHTKLIGSKVLVAKGLEMDFSDFVERDDIKFDDLPIAMIFAGEQDTYRTVFPDVNFVSGTYPAAGTNEVIIDTRVQRACKSLYGEEVKIGDTILLAGATADTVIREGVVSGIFNPPDENSAMFQIIYCNPEMARSFAGLTYASSFSQDLPDSIDLGLGGMSEDDLFGGFDDDEAFSFIEEDDSFLSTAATDFDAILGDTSLRDELNKTDDGSWQFVLMKCDRPYMTKKIIAELKQKFAEENVNAQVMDWKMAAYSYSGTVEGIGFIFNLLIFILAVVVFIIIMNTMVVSVIERTSEIGTMRAIGAEKKFVQRLFFSETIFLTLVSSVIGIILAFIIMAVFNACNIVITNSIAKMILGGGLLHFTPTPSIIITTIVIALIGSVVSNIYPVSSALKVTPLKALNHGE
ncbi:MAG: FtsX-like permease family protein [Treponema sp.]|nr:FtsX-like permease family protein [Treponema sp.]